MTRTEHVAWAKQRALTYVDSGKFADAFSSLSSDLGKHPETANHPGIGLGYMMLMSGQFKTADRVRDFINGLR